MSLPFITATLPRANDTRPHYNAHRAESTGHTIVNRGGSQHHIYEQGELVVHRHPQHGNRGARIAKVHDFGEDGLPDGYRVEILDLQGRVLGERETDEYHLRPMDEYLADDTPEAPAERVQDRIYKLGEFVRYTNPKSGSLMGKITKVHALGDDGLPDGYSVVLLEGGGGWSDTERETHASHLQPMGGYVADDAGPQPAKEDALLQVLQNPAVTDEGHTYKLGDFVGYIDGQLGNHVAKITKVYPEFQDPDHPWMYDVILVDAEQRLSGAKIKTDESHLQEINAYLIAIEPPYSRAPSNKRFADALAKVDNTPKPFEEEMSTCEEEAFWLIRKAIHYCIKLYDRASGGMYPVEKDYLEGFLGSSLPMKEDERLLMNTKLNYIKTIAGNGNGPIQRATRPRRDQDSNWVYIGVLRGWLEHFEDVAQFQRQTKGRRHRFS